MAKIKVLDKHVAELIAAGEVVERPASVIKELVENSIDAKATSVTIEIRNGGISYMRISDNGIGIDKEDVPTAFLRHATSKVENQEDLDAIASLGFRGEALASVSAVSHIELVTKTKSQNMGTKLISHGGDIEMISETGAPNGTTIIVRDIFYNVPARMKFLKKDVAEGNAVAAVVDKLALSHPEVSFKFVRDRKEVLFTPGNNKLSGAIYGVFGKQICDDLIPVSYDYAGIKLKGYITKPSAARASRTMQNFFINGRYIKSRTASVALEEACKGSLGVSKFPACVIHIQMNCSLLDVNVHPAKLDVRFVNEKPIFEAVYHGVKTALSKRDTPKEMYLEPKKMPINPYAPVDTPVQTSFSTKAAQPQMKAVPVKLYQTNEAVNEAKAQEVKVYEATKFAEPTAVQPIKNVATSIEKTVTQVPVAIVNEPTIKTETISNKNEYALKQIEISQEVIEQADECEKELSYEDFTAEPHKLIGQAFDTYIIIEYQNKLMMIDKHAAHERLLYEKLKSHKTEVYEQTLLTPIKVMLDKQSYTVAIENVEQFQKAGFEIDDFGAGTVLVRTAPLILPNDDIGACIIEICSYLINNVNKFDTEALEHLYHTMACKAAIKGGVKSNDLEIIHLAKALEENPEIRYCPHGRPIYVILSKREIEKQFDR